MTYFTYLSISIVQQQNQFVNMSRNKRPPACQLFVFLYLCICI